MTAAELISHRAQRTQAAMATELGAPLSSYRKWEQGVRRVPVWVSNQLQQGPRSLKIAGLGMDEVFALDQEARARGITLEELIGQFIREGLEKAPGKKKKRGDR